jgi:hypothetical protein
MLGYSMNLSVLEIQWSRIVRGYHIGTLFFMQL